jgi:hypothetical protein
VVTIPYLEMTSRQQWSDFAGADSLRTFVAYRQGEDVEVIGLGL